MSAHIEPLKITGVGPEAHRIDSHLLDEGGALRPMELVSAEIGDQQATLTLLEYHLRQRFNTPTTRGYPPRIFLSYRRESLAHIAWCKDLASRMTSAGFEVYLDALAMTSESPTPEVLAEFVANLADSDIVLTVITDLYLHGEMGSNSMRTWLFEEWSRIKTLSQWGLLEVIGVLRSGDIENSAWVTFSGALDWTVDIRSAPNDPQPVLDFLGDHRGGAVLSDSQQRLLADRAARTISSARASDVASTAALMQEIEDFAATEEYWLAASWHAHAAGDDALLLRAAEVVLRMNATLPTTFGVANVLWLADRDADAVGLLAEVAEAPSLWRHMSHYILGDIFDRLGMLVPAENHLRWCLKASTDNSLESRWSAFSGDMYELCLEHCQEVSSAIPDGVRRSVSATCSSCEAGFIGPWVCTLCAADYGKAQDRCFLCQSPVVRLEHLDFCPVCRKGRAGSPMEGQNRYQVPREPGGRFSVLARVMAPEIIREPGDSRYIPLGSWQQFIQY